MSWSVIALYKFTPVANPHALQAALKDICAQAGICGTLIVAPEGINGTVAAPDRPALDNLIAFLHDRLDFAGAEVKFSTAADQPFKRLKIKCKPEIVTLRQPQADPTRLCGTYVEAAAWNDLIQQDNVIVLDTRNGYETEIGAFENALIPNTRHFVHFPEFVEKNRDALKGKTIAMYCTGGIRCEKASSYMLAQGFDRVYHLKGGILKYLEEIPPEQSLWRGTCFVFDERESLKHGLEEEKTGWYADAKKGGR